jgi:hypothetical protein
MGNSHSFEDVGELSLQSLVPEKFQENQDGLLTHFLSPEGGEDHRVDGGLLPELRQVRRAQGGNAFQEMRVVGF